VLLSATLKLYQTRFGGQQFSVLFLKILFTPLTPSSLSGLQRTGHGQYSNSDFRQAIFAEKFLLCKPLVPNNMGMNPTRRTE
jgi:hypothetical protein